MQTTSPIHSEESTRGGRPPQPPEAASISAANPCGGNSQLFDPPSLKARRHRSVECPGTRPARAGAEYSSADPILVRLQLEGAFVSVHSVSLVSLRITCSAGIPIRLQLSKRFLESCWGRAVYRNPRALGWQIHGCHGRMPALPRFVAVQTRLPPSSSSICCLQRWEFAFWGTESRARARLALEGTDRESEALKFKGSPKTEFLRGPASAFLGE